MYVIYSHIALLRHVGDRSVHLVDIRDLFHGILGKGYRMDHLPMVLAQNKGSEGFQLHGGTIDCSSGNYNPHIAYHYHHGTIRSSLLGCNVILRDHNPGDGGFCVVPGSHKSNFKMPKGMVDGETVGGANLPIRRAS